MFALRKKIVAIGTILGLCVSPLAVIAVAHADSFSCLLAGANFNVTSVSAKGCNTAASTSKSTRPAPHVQTYYALGDSVAAGLGLPSGVLRSAQDKQCGRSSSSYASYVATRSGLPYQNLACSGATAGDLLTDQHIIGPNPEQQLGRAFANGTPELITITAGANDAQWNTFVRLCLTTNCNTLTNSRIVTASTKMVKAKLIAAMEYAYFKSGGNPPHIILTGYYNPVSLACVAQTNGQLNAYEISWLSSSLAELNTAIQSVAAAYSFVDYTNVSFTGHDICSASSWIQGINDPAPLHPTARGQQEIARNIARLL